MGHSISFSPQEPHRAFWLYSGCKCGTRAERVYLKDDEVRITADPGFIVKRDRHLGCRLEGRLVSWYHGRGAE